MSQSYPAAAPPSYNQAVGGPYDGAGFPPSSDPVQGGKGYPPSGPGYPPAGQGYPPAGPGYPPSVAPYTSQPQDQGYGYGEQPKPDEVPEAAFNNASDQTFNTASFSDKAVRRGFIRKVYLILMAQLIVTFGVACLFSFVQPLKFWMRTTGHWFYYLSYGIFLVTYIILVCIPGVRRKYPGNFICLAIFTLAFSYMVGTISSFYDSSSVLVAAGITAGLCLALTIFAMQTKIDFTMCSGLLFALIMVLLLFGFSCMIVYFTLGYNRILDCVWGGLAALVFSMFLIYDTQMLMGGRKYQLDPDEYIYGALQLYLDVVYLFVILLGLFGKSS